MNSRISVFRTILLLAAVLASAGAVALDPAEVPADKRTSLNLYFTAAEANAYVAGHRGKTLFIDVRDPAELHTQGMPNAADANVPVQRINFSKWDPAKKRFAFDDNPDFVNGVSERLKAKRLGKNDTVVVMCAIGARTPLAVNALARAGYTRVYAVVDGFSGWQRAQLPWDRELDRAKMYGDPR